MSKGKLLGTKGTSRTDIFFTTYDEKVANNLINIIKSKYKVLKVSRSKVLSEFYYISLEGKVKDVEDIVSTIKGITWYKIDYIEFR